MRLRTWDWSWSGPHLSDLHLFLFHLFMISACPFNRSRSSIFFTIFGHSWSWVHNHFWLFSICSWSHDAHPISLHIYIFLVRSKSPPIFSISNSHLLAQFHLLVYPPIFSSFHSLFTTAQWPNLKVLDWVALDWPFKMEQWDWIKPTQNFKLVQKKRL